MANQVKAYKGDVQDVFYKNLKYNKAFKRLMGDGFVMRYPSRYEFFICLPGRDGANKAALKHLVQMVAGYMDKWVDLESVSVKPYWSSGWDGYDRYVIEYHLARNKDTTTWVKINGKYKCMPLNLE